MLISFLGPLSHNVLPSRSSKRQISALLRSKAAFHLHSPKLFVVGLQFIKDVGYHVDIHGLQDHQIDLFKHFYGLQSFTVLLAVDDFAVVLCWWMLYHLCQEAVKFWVHDCCCYDCSLRSVWWFGDQKTHTDFPGRQRVIGYNCLLHSFVIVYATVWMERRLLQERSGVGRSN